jgi:hypothetical protein
MCQVEPRGVTPACRWSKRVIRAGAAIAAPVDASLADAERSQRAKDVGRAPLYSRARVQLSAGSACGRLELGVGRTIGFKTTCAPWRLFFKCRQLPKLRTIRRQPPDF